MGLVESTYPHHIQFLALFFFLFILLNRPNGMHSKLNLAHVKTTNTTNTTNTTDTLTKRLKGLNLVVKILNYLLATHNKTVN